MSFRGFLACSIFCFLSTGSLLAEQPNLVLILADDMGYGDVHALNASSRIPTPNLDRLAREGMTFTDAHTGSAVCTPTRYGLLTGRYCWRSRLKSGVLDGYGKPLIEPDRPTLASFLTAEGYRTGIVGKWHLGLGFAKQGDDWDFEQPVSDGAHTHGFDYSYIIPASLDFPPYGYLENGEFTAPPSLVQESGKFPAFLRRGPRSPDLVMEECLDHLLGKALGFIRREAKAEQPFFLYFPLTAPHKPVLPHPRFRGKTELGPYGDFVAQVDWTVGEVLKALDETGIAKDTLVIYTSDNGSFMVRREEGEDHVGDPTIQAYLAAHHTSNYHFRGTKADIWEAGHHVPFLVRWPGRIAAGAVSEPTICLTDVFATMGELLGAELGEGTAPDSFSFLPLLSGDADEYLRPPVIHHSAAGMFAIRDGRWKLVLGNGSGGRETPRGKPFEKPFMLFDLEADPGEKKDRIAEEPEVAARLEEACRELREREGRSGE